MLKKLVSILVIASLLCSSANAGIAIERIGGKGIRQQSGTSKLLALNTAPFFAPLTSNLTLARGTGSPTFTRATTATVVDFEGNVKTALAGEARFTGARRVQNLVQKPEALSDAYWINTTMTITSGILAPDNSTTAFTLTAAGASSQLLKQTLGIAGHTFICQTWIRRRSGTGAISLVRADGNAYVDITASVTTSWQLITTGANSGGGAGGWGVLLATSGDQVDVWHPQNEDITGQSNQNPSEYISSTWNDTGAAGVRYFEYLNGNTVAANVVTQAQGIAINPSTLQGYLSEIASTNLVWPSGYLVAGVTQTTAPLTAASYTLSFKGTGSVTGTGGFVGTLNGTGVNNKVLLTVTATAAAATLTVTGSITEMQLELGSLATSNIPTTTAAATRNADVLTYPAAGNILSGAGSSYAEASHNNPAIVGAVDSIVGTNTSGRLLESPNDTTLRVIDSATNIATINLLSSWSASFGTAKKIASSWGTGMAVTSEGQTPSVQATFTSMSTANPIGIGCFGSGTNQIGGNVKNVRIWQIQLPNTTLQVVTTP